MEKVTMNHEKKFSMNITGRVEQWRIRANLHNHTKSPKYTLYQKHILLLIIVVQDKKILSEWGSQTDGSYIILK